MLPSIRRVDPLLKVSPNKEPFKEPYTLNRKARLLRLDFGGRPALCRSLWRGLRHRPWRVKDVFEVSSGVEKGFLTVLYGITRLE